MEMIIQQGPCRTGSFGLQQDFPESSQEIIAIVFIPEYFCPFDTPDNDVMQRTGGIYS
jgi:hypothetical protein